MSDEPIEGDDDDEEEPVTLDVHDGVLGGGSEFD